MSNLHFVHESGNFASQQLLLIGKSFKFDIRMEKIIGSVKFLDGWEDSDLFFIWFEIRDDVPICDRVLECSEHTIHVF